MRDDWRLRIELSEEHATGLLDWLGLDFSAEARELASELEDERLAVSRDGDTVFVYAGSSAQAEKARALVGEQLKEQGLAGNTRIEHWLGEEDRWDDEPPGPDVEEELAARGYAPWEVRVECESHHEAEELADMLEEEGHAVVRRWRYVLVGAPSREDAQKLARRLHGEVEPGGELVWEVLPTQPFVVFGGLGGSGTPI